MKKVALIVILAAIISGIGFWWYISIYTKSQTPKEVTLTVWGLWDEEAIINPVLEAYQKSYPNVKISYVKQSTLNYYPRLITQLRSGFGPDIFTIHNSWLPMMISDLDVLQRGDFKGS
ncbi:MAG: ABC superfamily ATP binding cassette transporter, binding protein [Candidatus Daviesbacteria bacterium GW2011_GWA2_40_9]|uniref:ABC superfamily ATP binding cassette transporter, binding protein n=1 Tax=Candidatus Daviesbacteria bacterium GW2011_GWA2_40_9 TaxID=1618424 RepID=A0A0G0X537_9BACT|nr:MAG: ABC superfamily ATP binding cassette transporter, binding protein [Candidatus Daviesbacteria bacterium GW2011_GWA2_40_9]